MLKCNIDIMELKYNILIPPLTIVDSYTTKVRLNRKTNRRLIATQGFTIADAEITRPFIIIILRLAFAIGSHTHIYIYTLHVHIYICTCVYRYLYI